MKSLAFATYWLMVFAVISSIGAYENSIRTEMSSELESVSYTDAGVDCYTKRHDGGLAGVASDQCIN